MKRNLLLAGLATTLLLGPTSAQADDSDLALIIGGLGLGGIEGKTEVGAGGGDVEAAIMTAELMNDIVSTICASLVCSKTTDTLILGDADTLDIQAYATVRQKLAALEKELNSVCVTDPFGVQSGGDLKLISGLFGSALRKDEKITGVAASASDLMLASQFADYFGPHAIFPGYGLGSADSNLQKKLDGLEKRAIKIANDKDCKEEAEVKVALKLLEDSKKSLFSGEKPMFDKALLVEPIAEKLAENKLRILRFKIEKAGGTLINSKSLLTQLGAPALTLSTGLVMSFRSIDENRTAVTGGVIVCRSGAKKLHSITRPKKADAPETTVGRCQRVMQLAP